MGKLTVTPPGPQAEATVADTPEGSQLTYTPGPPSAVSQLLNVFPRSQAEADPEIEAG
jgi:hypothetical protein